MLIHLTRNKPKGQAIFGRLFVDGAYFCDTLEHTRHAIPAGFYRVRITFSPRFQELLPILDGVYGYRKENIKNNCKNNSSLGERSAKHSFERMRDKNIPIRLEEQYLKQHQEQHREQLVSLATTQRATRGERLTTMSTMLHPNQLSGALKENDISTIKTIASNNNNNDYRRRVGIRIHAGNTIEHTEGCILVGERHEAKGERLLSSRKALDRLRDYLMNYQKQNHNEEIYIEITEPDAYPLYDHPCPPELQKR